MSSSDRNTESKVVPMGLRRILSPLRSPHFWAVLLLFGLLVVLHYLKQVPAVKGGGSLSLLGLERHALERILFLGPIAYSAYVFGLRGGVAVLAAALVAMLPRVFLLSAYPRDALYETVVTVGIGILLNAWFAFRRREIGKREQTILKLESVRRELQRIGRRYREIFEKANDAIWIHDLQDGIITANEACANVTGYSQNEMMQLGISRIFAAPELERLKDAEADLLSGREIRLPFELRIVKRDNSRAVIMLSISLLGDEKTPAFMHIARDMTEERKMEDSLRLYASQIGRAHEEERKRIARELHDDTIQVLVGVSRHLDNIIARDSRKSTALRRSLESAHAEIDESVVRIRRYVQSLRPPILDFLGLVPALRELAENVQTQFGLEVNLELDRMRWDKAPEEQLLIYRIVQEALQNAGRHSGASRATISLHSQAGGSSITVRDNGGGFNASDDAALLGSGRLGLIGMRERANLLGGTLDLQSSADGTTVVLSIPSR